MHEDGWHRNTRNSVLVGDSYRIYRRVLGIFLLHTHFGGFEQDDALEDSSPSPCLGRHLLGLAATFTPARGLAGNRKRVEFSSNRPSALAGLAQPCRDSNCAEAGSQAPTNPSMVARV